MSTFVDGLPSKLTQRAGQVIASDATISDIKPMPGHAGLSSGFTVHSSLYKQRLAVRFAPPGIIRRGNTDVLRQIPLLVALEDSAVLDREPRVVDGRSRMVRHRRDRPRISDRRTAAHVRPGRRCVSDRR